MAVLSQPTCPDSLPDISWFLQEGDHRWINSIARALQLLNSLYGPFGKAYGIGRCAKVRPTLPGSAGTQGSLSGPLKGYSSQGIKHHQPCGIVSQHLLLIGVLRSTPCPGGQSICAQP